MLLTRSPKSFNTSIKGDSVGGFNFPDPIIDLGSIIGLVISCLVEGNEFSQVLSKLDFYARFLHSFQLKKLIRKKMVMVIAIATICVVFDGENKPFWFGSTLATELSKTENMQIRQKILIHALKDRKITLPLMPPTHQRNIGRYLRNFIIDKGGHPLADNEMVANRCVKLLQLIVQPLEPTTENIRPWEIVATVNPTDYQKRVKAISSKISAVGFPEELAFENLKKSLNDAVKKCTGQQYGHCAETYPLLSMFRFVSLFPKLSMEVSLIPLRRRKESTPPSKYQGLARSVSGFQECDEFYAGDAPGTMACNGSGKCKMKCAGEGEGEGGCTRACGSCQDRCEGGQDCKTVCQQNKGCQTRCCGGGGCKTQKDLLAACKNRITRCEACEEDRGECNEATKCWRSVCEPCMDSPASCVECRKSTDVRPCFECGHFMPPCENCQALITQLGFEDWNKFLKHRNHRWTDNHYLM